MAKYKIEHCTAHNHSKNCQQSSTPGLSLILECVAHLIIACHKISSILLSLELLHFHCKTTFLMLPLDTKNI